jgi:UDP-N-acetyl-alpha-D-quinovosamine dehydrogenase
VTVKVLVTGASGFIGRALLERLSNDGGFTLHAAVRRAAPQPVSGVSYVQVSDHGRDTVWTDAMRETDVLVHAAARVHVMNDGAADPLTEFRLANVEATLNLARQAVLAGVRRFVFISSIKVNGDGTPLGKPYRADDRPAPADPYGVSKLEAENGLRELLRGTETRLVVIRPVLVYGPAVRANFLTMMHWVHRGIPLPFANISNKRSFVALDNLVDLIVACCVRTAALDQTFLAADGEDLSTTEILKRIAAAMNQRARLFPAPTELMRGVMSLLGRADLARRLFGSLQADISKARSVLGWAPPVSVDDALRDTARHFLGTVR